MEEDKRCENCIYCEYIKDRGHVCCIAEWHSGMLYDIYSDENCEDFK